MRENESEQPPAAEHLDPKDATKLREAQAQLEQTASQVLLLQAVQQAQRARLEAVRELVEVRYRLAPTDQLRPEPDGRIRIVRATG
jgi:hypothetical protein